MNGTTSTRVLIVGGGMAGLAAAWELSRQQVPWVLVESGARAGGVIRTERIDDYLLDAGPDSFIVTKPWAMELCRELGLEGQLISVPVEHRRTFILRGGHLVPLPPDMFLGIPTRLRPLLQTGLFSWRGKLRMAAEYPRELVRFYLGGSLENGDESIEGFVRRRLGQEACDRLLGPLLAGIHAGDPGTLSIRSTFPQLTRLEDEYGGLIRGALALRRARPPRDPMQPPPSPFRSLVGGMQQLVDRLVADLPGDRLRLGAPVLRLSSHGPAAPPGWTAELAGGHTIRARDLLLAVPAHVAAGLLHDVAPDLANDLRAIRYVSTATLHLGWPRSAFPQPPVGTGFLIPRTERRQILACTYSSNKFPHRAAADRVLVRVFFGGARDEAMAGRDEAQLLAIARAELAELIGVQAAPELVRLFRYPKSNPQYEVGHGALVARIRAREAQLVGLQLVGSPYEGVGIPDAVRQGRQAAARVL